MFENPGQKIKTWANVVFMIGLIGSVLGGILIMAAGSYNRYAYSGGSGFLSGLLVMALGTLGSFLGALLLYALGTVVEGIENIDSRLQRMEELANCLNSRSMPVQKVNIGVARQIDAPTHSNAANDNADKSPMPAANIKDEKAKPMPEHYVIVERTGPSLVCPACGIKQPSYYTSCLSCGIAFIEKGKMEQESKTAGNATADNSALKAAVKRDTLSLQCPLCKEIQPSNLERCRKCNVKFVDQV